MLNRVSRYNKYSALLINVILFSSLNGIKCSSVSSKSPPSSTRSKKNVLLTLSCLDSPLSASIVNSANVTVDIVNTAPDFQIQPLYWQGYKFSYTGQDGKDNTLFLIEEVPDEPVEKKSLWKRLLS